MFGKLAMAKHQLIATKDHNIMITEAASDVIGMDDPNNDISMEDLDAVMANDTTTVSQEEIEQLDGLIAQIVDKDANKNVATMTTEEIQKHVDSVAPTTLAELND